MGQFKGKAIYNPSGKAGEYSYWACNFYNGCSHRCTYCYLKKGRAAKVQGGDYPTLKKGLGNEVNAMRIFEKELSKPAHLSELRKCGLFFSFTTDPMLDETVDLTLHALDVCIAYDVPVKILTKNVHNVLAHFVGFPGHPRKSEFYRHHADKIAVGFTLTGHSEMEPGAPTNAERVMAMREMHAAGFKTFASIEPIVDFPTAKRMIEFTLGTCDLYKIGLMAGQNYNLPEVREFVEWLRSIHPAPAIYLKERLQKMSGYASPGNMEVIANARPLEANFVDRDYNIFNFR